jgi:DNA modification methylase
MQNLEQVPIGALKPYAGNARTHSKKQIQQIAKSIARFGFTNPVLVSPDMTIAAGHGRVEAAKTLGITHIPVLRLSNLSPAEIRAYVLADNRIAEKAGWDRDLLAIELQALSELDLDFDIELTGFEIPEIDILIGEKTASDPNACDGDDEADAIIPPQAPAITRLGDLWQVGRHRLLCGDALAADQVAQLMDGAHADMIFTDPPYNVRIDGFAGGKGKDQRREFAMASGEMSEGEFERFLSTAFQDMSDVLKDGAIAFVCMDWRHMREVQNAASSPGVFSELKNVCVWTKSNGGMGSLYRSQHEFVFVFKKGAGAHLNNVELGKHGRNRTNVWAYAGVNAFGSTRSDELAMHPTVKPVDMIADAIKDVTPRNALVLDTFGGSGSTLIAAHKCGRTARLIELDPLYCDVIIRRWQKLTGQAAVRSSDGARFEECEPALAPRAPDAPCTSPALSPQKEDLPAQHP